MYSGQIVGGAAAPFKRGFVVLDRHVVEFDGPHQRRVVQRHPALLPGIAQQHRVGIQRVTHQRVGHRVSVKAAHAVQAHGTCHHIGAIVLRVLPVGVAHKGRCGRAVGVERHMRAPFAHTRQRFGVDCDQRVGGQHQVGRCSAHTRGADRVLRRTHQHMAPGGAALLRQARRVLCDDAFAFDVRGHTQQLADGDDTRATDTGDDDAPDLVMGELGNRGLWHRSHLEGRIGFVLRLLLERTAFDGDKTRAETFQATRILVAGALVDGAFAAKFGFQRLDRQAVALYAAVAAAFTHQLVDDHPHGRVDSGATLAAAALLGGAGLVVNDGGGAFDLAELALDVVEQIAVFHLRVTRHLHALVLLGLVGDDHHFGRAFGQQALGNLQHRVAFGSLTDGLAAGHRDRVVVQNFVSDVHPRRDALADRQQAAVEVGAVAQVREDVLVGREGLLADPWHTFTAHLGEANGAAVHPSRHEVAANAPHGT